MMEPHEVELMAKLIKERDQLKETMAKLRYYLLDVRRQIDDADPLWVAIDIALEKCDQTENTNS